MPSTYGEINFQNKIHLTANSITFNTKPKGVGGGLQIL
jgi:hypothetical protein